MSLLAIKYDRGHLEILNQLLLPHESVYEEIRCVEDGWQAIRSMKVQFGYLIVTCSSKFKRLSLKRII